MENPKNNNCNCGVSDKIVLCCSGAADLGEISDKVARKLNSNGIRKMSCLALVGASIETSIENFKSSNLLLIDGCSVECGRKALDEKGISNYKYMKISDLGFVKGQTKIVDENIDSVYNTALLVN